MSAEILTQIPKSGDYPEKHFGENFNSQLWVKFVDNDDIEWVGCFPRQYENFDKVETNLTNETAFIIAGGKGFLVDIQKRELCYELDEIPVIESLIVTTNPEYYLVGACYYIYIFDSRQLLKCYEPNFIVDGIYLTEQLGHKAIGHLYSYQFSQDYNVGFEFDILTNELTINKKVKYRQLKNFQFEAITEKPKTDNIFTKIIKKEI